jgi:chromosomal replication initiation ATPase DnaA
MKLPPMIYPTGRAQTKPRPNRNLNNVELGRTIIDRVCGYYNFTPEQVKGTNRNDSISWVRAVAMDVCCMAGLSHETTGKLVCRDHSTVCSARSKVEDYCQQFPDLAEDRLKLAGEFIELDAA